MTFKDLIMAGQFLPPDERAIQPPALVPEYIPSINLYDVPSAAITPAMCAQLVSAIESVPSYGVIHNDITSTNIHSTPLEQPVRVVVIDFECSLIREDDGRVIGRRLVHQCTVGQTTIRLGKNSCRCTRK